MLTRYHIRLLIEKCRELGSIGGINDSNAIIPPIEIDFLVSPNDFLGVHKNPAIFINQNTFKKLGHLHPNWVADKTIALKPSFLTLHTIEAIGAIVHESGHAFNVAANIENTEANAYIFEIEVLMQLFESQSPLLFACSYEDLQMYFNSRLTYYQKSMKDNPLLATLVESLKDQFKLTVGALQLQNYIIGHSVTFFVAKDALKENYQWSRENEIILSKMLFPL